MSIASSEERSGALITYILTALLGVLGALIGWFIFKEKGPFARSQTTEALNWGITMFIAYIVINILTIVLAKISPSLGLVGLLSLVLLVANLVLSILGALKAKDGNAYRYPFALRLIK